MDLRSVLADVAADLADLEQFLMDTLSDGPPSVRGVAVHLLQAGGKRVRPALVLLGAKFGDYAYRALRPVAAAAEMIHMATLVHDDVIDRADLRRGQATVHARWGEQTAVLAGDYLFAKAFALLAETGVSRVVGIMADVVFQMCSGEIEQNAVAASGRLPDEAAYLRRIAKKTALFIAESCRAGAVISGAGEEAEQALYNYGYSIGMGFQIIDDLLDLTAEPVVLGKAVGSDLRAHVATLPLIHGLHSSRRANELEHLAQSQIVTSDVVDEVRRILGESDSFGYAERLAHSFISRAKSSLEGLRDLPARASLLQMADFVVGRSL